MPCERLRLQVAGAEANRPFRLEIANPNEPRQDIGNIDWKWRRDAKGSILEAAFPEVIARRLRLVVTDFDNPPLNIAGAEYTSCVRQVIFPTAAEAKFTPPLWLYYGNPEANAPHYDLERQLPAVLHPQPVQATLGEQRDNPAYVPPPESLSQRMPWLVYVVLGVACAVLLGILALLAQRTSCPRRCRAARAARALTVSSLASERNQTIVSPASHARIGHPPQEQDRARARRTNEEQERVVGRNRACTMPPAPPRKPLLAVASVPSSVTASVTLWKPSSRNSSPFAPAMADRSARRGSNAACMPSALSSCFRLSA